MYILLHLLTGLSEGFFFCVFFFVDVHQLDNSSLFSRLFFYDHFLHLFFSQLGLEG
ncbi:hypothetical protein EX30DRAFT_341988 [Ascodesmis nigricans]|uniref:Uncharacterized protein n=1 Tax=Ascodesmis nigricans TaxID=341454 RepID=A0A4S2MTS6_9PEZI|nr:hypothetical protein EX30DRAFT_341988 [Ascodesmis nigricans]